MDSVITVRLEKDVKEKATKILMSRNLTPSAAVQQFFDAIVKTGDMPLRQKTDVPSPEEIKRRLQAMDRLHTRQPVRMTDDEIRAARLKEKYDIDVR